MFFFNSFYFALQHFIENARNILLGRPAKTNFTLNQEWNYSSFMKRSLNFITEPILYPFNGSLNKSCLMNKKWGFLDTFEYHKQTWNYGIFAIWWRERWTPTKKQLVGNERFLLLLYIVVNALSFYAIFAFPSFSVCIIIHLCGVYNFLHFQQHHIESWLQLNI